MPNVFQSNLPFIFQYFTSEERVGGGRWGRGAFYLFEALSYWEYPMAVLRIHEPSERHRGPPCVNPDWLGQSRPKGEMQKAEELSETFNSMP